MKKKIFPVSLAAISLFVFLSGCGQSPPAVNTPKTPEAVSQEARPDGNSGTNETVVTPVIEKYEIDPLTLKKGDKLGSWIVVSVGSAVSGKEISADNYKIMLSGILAVEGSYESTGEDNMSGVGIDFTLKSPYLLKGGKELFSRFCLSETAQKDLGKPGTKGKAEIVIKNLVLTSFYEGCQNEAELVRVQSKVLNPGSSS